MPNQGNGGEEPKKANEKAEKEIVPEEDNRNLKSIVYFIIFFKNLFMLLPGKRDDDDNGVDNFCHSDIEDRLNESTEDSEQKKSKSKKGRMKGATKYTNVDLKQILRCVSETLPFQSADWQATAELYSKLYAIPYERADRSAKAISSKFREMLWGEASGGGESSPLQQEAKDIQRRIDAKTGTLPAEMFGVTADDKAVESPVEVKKKYSSSNSLFKKKLLDSIEMEKKFMEEQRVFEEKRLQREEKMHEEKMSLFSKI